MKSEALKSPVINAPPKILAKCDQCAWLGTRALGVMNLSMSPYEVGQTKSVEHKYRIDLMLQEYVEHETIAIMWVLLLLVTFLLMRRLGQLLALWIKGNRLPGPPICLLRRSKIKNLSVYLATLHREYGSIVRVWLGPTTLLVSVKDHEMVRELLRVASDRNQVSHKALDLVFGRHCLFNATFSQAVGKRSALSQKLDMQLMSKLPSFSTRLLKDIEHWKIASPEGINCKALSQYIAISSLGTSYFSKDFINWPAAHEFKKLLLLAVDEACFWSQYAIIPFWKRNFRKYKTTCLRLQTVLREILTNCGEEEPSQTKDGLHGGSKAGASSDFMPRGSSFLEELTNYLIDFVSGDSKSSLAVQDINGNLIGMFYHGFLTMSSLLNGVFSRLAQHPDVQAKVFSEVHQISEGTISSEDKLKKMKYLIATVYESARLLPTNQILQRCSRGHDISLGGLVIPAGAVVAIPVHTVQTDVEHWGQDAEKFNPGRFFRSAPGEAKLQKSGEKTVDVGMFSKSEVLDVKPPECSGVLKDDGFLDMEQSGMPENFIEDPSFLLFGGGARACVGRNFVTMTVVSLVAELLQVFEIIVGPSNVDLSKAEDIKVLFKPRNYVVD